MHHKQHRNFVQLLDEVHEKFEIPKRTQNTAGYAQNKRPGIGEYLRKTAVEIRRYGFYRACEWHMLSPMREKWDNITAYYSGKHQIEEVRRDNDTHYDDHKSQTIVF